MIMSFIMRDGSELMSDRVMNRETRNEGFIVMEMTGVVEEDNFGDMKYPEAAFVSVEWDNVPGFYDHVSRGRLVPIAGYRIGPFNSSVGAYLSETFKSRQSAQSHRADALCDPEGKQYTIFPVDEHGNVL
jgi:hypothetical protein